MYANRFRCHGEKKRRADLDLRTIENPAWREGLGSSIACGMDASTGDASLILLADQPGVDAALLRRLIDGARAGPRRVACAYGDGLGAPALFTDPADLDRLRRSRGDRGARALLAAEPESVLAIPASDAAVDIDDETDWARWQSERSTDPTTERSG